MEPKINHIGLKQERADGFRYKRLRHSGIFRGDDTRSKLIDCQGSFEQWTNAPARAWINARVKEYRDGRHVHIVCDCCESRDAGGVMNDKCHGQEIVELIIQLATSE